MTEAKPATGDQIEAMRARLKIENEYEMPPWNGNSVAILIARIDAERARVKVLEDALWDMIRNIELVSGNLYVGSFDWVLHDARAALKGGADV